MTEPMRLGICFDVQGIPRAQPRCKARAIVTNQGRATAMVYDPKTADDWKAIVMADASQHCPPEPLDGPLEIMVIFRFKRPKSHFRTGKHASELKPDASIWHTTKPDADNLIKAVKDALTNVGMWQDDARVCRQVVDKRYVWPGEQPGCQIRIERASG
jgi:Holliday junction resolvase RusA-like endonuclease